MGVDFIPGPLPDFSSYKIKSGSGLGTRVRKGQCHKNVF